MKKTLFILAILICTRAKSQEMPETITNNFFKLYENNVTDAVSYVFSTNHYFTKPQVIEITKKLNDVIKIVGEFYGYEPIQKESIGNNFILLNYIIKYERQPIKFSFVLYKPKDKWILYNFNFNSELDEELQSAAKINLLIK